MVFLDKDIPEMAESNFVTKRINMGQDKIIRGEHSLFLPYTKAFIPAGSKELKPCLKARLKRY